jgi:hypothetical protein
MVCDDITCACIGTACHWRLAISPWAYSFCSPAGELLDNPSFDGAASSFSTNDGNISGTMPEGWYDNTEWAGPEIALRYSVVPQPVHSGSRSLRIEVEGGFAQFTQWRELPAGEAYRLRLWVRAQPTAAPAAVAAADTTIAAAAGTDDPADAGVTAFTINHDGAGATAVGAAADAAAAGGLSVTLGLRLAGPPYTMFDSISATVGSSWTQLEVPAAVIPQTAAAANPGQNISVGFMVSTGGLGTLWLDDASLTLVEDLPELTVITNKAAVVTRQYFCMNINHMGGREYDWKPGYEWPVIDFGVYRTVSSSTLVYL